MKYIKYNNVGRKNLVVSEDRKLWYLPLDLDSRVKKTDLINQEKFAQLFFRNAKAKRQAFIWLFNKFKDKHYLFLMKDIVNETKFGKLPFGQFTLNNVWKHMKAGRLIARKDKESPHEFSSGFYIDLIKIAIQWINLLSAYKIVNKNAEINKLIKILEQSKDKEEEDIDFIRKQT